jgi:two-component system OmpR family sensor kinase
MRNSLRLRLSLWISCFILLAGLIAAGVSFALAYSDANEMQDNQLRQLAALASTGRVSGIPRDARNDDSDSESRLLIEEQGGPGMLGQLSRGLPDGIATVRGADESWRIVVRQLPTGRRIAVGQPTALRDEIAFSSAFRTLVPLLALIPALVILLAILVKALFEPVGKLAALLDRRDAGDAGALSHASVPSEIAPFVQSINGLLERVARLIGDQQRFIADAAHELRSPVTALLLQAENLERCEMPAETRERLVPLRAGLARARALLEQLLSLALQQNTTPDGSQIRMDEVVREVLRDLLPLALTRQVAVEVPTLEPLQVRGTLPQLSALVRNALDNAVRYSPRGGQVKIALSADGDDAVLAIDDSGPGLAEGDLEQVFAPFYRVPGSTETGSGLGLAIARAVAQRLGGQVTLANLHPHGLRLSYRQPLLNSPTHRQAPPGSD